MWLNTKNIATCCPSRKLDHHRVGPYKIVKVACPGAYKLEHLNKIQIHLVQHVLYLDPIRKDLFPGQRMPSPPPVQVYSEDE